MSCGCGGNKVYVKGERGPQGPMGPKGNPGSVSNSTLVYQDAVTQGSEVSGGAFVEHTATDYTMPAGSLVAAGDMLRYSVFMFAGDTSNPTVDATADRYFQIRLDDLNMVFNAGYPDNYSNFPITAASLIQRVNISVEFIRLINTQLMVRMDVDYYNKSNAQLFGRTYINSAMNIAPLGKTLDADSLKISTYVKQDSDLAKNRLHLLDVRVEKFNL